MNESRSSAAAAEQERTRYRYIFDAVGVSIWEEDFSAVKAAIAALKRDGVQDFRTYFAEHPRFVQTAIASVQILDVNDATLRLLETDSRDQILKSLHQIFLPETVEAFIGELLVIAAGETYYEAETVVKTLRGTLINVLLTVTFPPPDEPYDRVLITLVDISDRKQLEQTLLHRTQELDRANRIKDDFLAILSHELRTPLNPILGWTQLLQAQRLDAERTRHALDTIERNAKAQIALVDDLLDVSRILRGRLRLQRQGVDVRQVTEAVMEALRLAGDAKHLEITFHPTPEHSNFLVLGDRDRLGQMIWNLLSNAIKFTAINGAIDLQLKQLDSTIELQVSDTGQGIDPTFLPYIFDSFRQQDSTTTREFGGLGLGLAIVRHLVESHGGTIHAVSRGRGCGATFIVTLPILRVTEPEDPEIASAPARSTSWGAQSDESTAAELCNINILVVDDEPDSLELVAFVLQDAGASVTTAGSAREALNAIARYPFDVIVSDIGMPNMNGYQLIETLRSQFKFRSIPAIALTAFASDEDRDRAIAAGFHSHLTKPIEPSDVIDAIRAVLRA